jgi:hypothetical protein
MKMLELKKIDGKQEELLHVNLVTGEIERHSAHAVVIASEDTNVFYRLMRWVVMQLPL